MAYVSLHPEVTATVKRLTTAEVTGSGGKQRSTLSTVGSVVGGFEDLPMGDVVHGPDGKLITLGGRLYAARTVDLPVRRGDFLSFSDPATSEARAFEVVDRRGPFDSTDPEDHVELDLKPEKADA